MFWKCSKIRNEEIPRPNTLIPYFTAYVIHYYYYLRKRGDRLKLISASESASKNESIKN